MLVSSHYESHSVSILILDLDVTEYITICVLGALWGFVPVYDKTSVSYLDTH